MKTLNYSKKNFLSLIIIGLVLSTFMFSCEKTDSIYADDVISADIDPDLRTEIISVDRSQWQDNGNNQDQATLDSDLLKNFQEYDQISVFVLGQKSDAIDGDIWVELPDGSINYNVNNTSIVALKSCGYCPAHLTFKVQIRVKNPSTVKENNNFPLEDIGEKAKKDLYLEER